MAGRGWQLILAWAVLLSTMAGGRAERVTVRPHGAVKRRAPGRRLLTSVAALMAAVGANPAKAQEEDKATFSSAAFDVLDTNKDGKVDPEEFRASATSSLGSMRVEEKDAQARAYAFFDKLYVYADIDGDGYLSPREVDFGQLVQATVAQRRLQKKLRDLAEPGNPDKDRELDQFGRDIADAVMENHDDNKDGKIDRSEYDKGMRESATSWGYGRFLEDPDMLQWFEDLWDTVDVDRDGSLSAREAQFAAFLTEVTFSEPRWPDKSFAGMMFAELDTNDDGKLDLSEIEAGKKLVEEQRPEGEEGTTVIDKLEGMFSEVDADGDQSLNIEEAVVAAKRLLGEL